MTVFANRIRCAYLRRRQRREMAVGLVLLLGIFAACGIAGSIDSEAKEKPFAGVRVDRSVCVVDGSVSVPMYDCSGR